MITIKDYMNYKCALENPNTTDFEKHIEILAMLCGLQRSDLMQLPARQITPLFNSMEFLKKQPTSEVKEFYEIAGKKYKLIMDVNKLTAGQFIDLSHYTKDPELIIDNLHLVCSVLMLPVIPYRGKKNVDIVRTEKYLETPIDETSEFLYNNMPITEALGISNFFTFLFDVFIQITKHYLEQERTKQLNRASKMLSEAMTASLKPETGSTINGNGSRR